MSPAGNDPNTDSEQVPGSARTGTRPGGSQQSLIGPSVTIRGEVSADENLLVRGRIEGVIEHRAQVTIHAEGTVSASLKAEDVIVEGTVEGDVFGTSRVRITETGRVTGNVCAPRVSIEDGARFKGSVDMDPEADDVERRFREQTGRSSGSGDAADSAVSRTQGADRASTGGKSTRSKERADRTQGVSNAAQADGKGAPQTDARASGSSG